MMKRVNHASGLVNLALVGGSIMSGLLLFQAFDLVYSRLNKRHPFALPALKNNGVALYRSGSKGWYELNPGYRGEDRYGKLTYKVNTDANSFRSSEPGHNADQQSSNPAVFMIGDSFIYGVGSDWADTISAQLSALLKTRVINAGVNSHSPTPHVHRLKQLLNRGAIPAKAIIIMAVDISDVQDEATRWRDGSPTPIDRSVSSAASATNTQPSQANESFYSPKNFKLSHQIYYFFEAIVKRYIDNIQVRNLSRSAFTHRSWQSLREEYQPLGVSGGLKRIENKIKAAALISQSNKHPFYLLIYPWPAQLAYANAFNWNEAISSFCQPPECNGVINTFPDFKAMKNDNKNWQNTYYISGDMHFNATGNRLIAESIAAKLRKDHRIASPQH